MTKKRYIGVVGTHPIIRKMENIIPTMQWKIKPEMPNQRTKDNIRNMVIKISTMILAFLLLINNKLLKNYMRSLFYRIDSVADIMSATERLYSLSIVLPKPVKSVEMYNPNPSSKLCSSWDIVDNSNVCYLCIYVVCLQKIIPSCCLHILFKGFIWFCID